MNAEITADGTLTISPENDLESFALQAWWSHWNKHELCVMNPSTFKLELPALAEPGKNKP